MKTRTNVLRPLFLFCLLLLCRPQQAAAQAEQTPTGSLPPEVAPPPPPPPRPILWPRVGVIADIRLSGLLGETRQVAPPLGWGFGLKLTASLLPLGRLVRLGFVLDYEQDRFSHTFADYPAQPQELVHNTFALMPQVDLHLRWLRPFFAAGAGASQARHQSPLPDPFTMMSMPPDVALVPLFRIGAGLGVTPLRWLEVGLSADISLTLSSQKGGVQLQNGLLSPGQATIFAPGWWSAAFYAAYQFY